MNSDTLGNLSPSCFIFCPAEMSFSTCENQFDVDELERRGEMCLKCVEMNICSTKSVSETISLDI